MCNTPRPKRNINARTANDSVGFLSAISCEKRKSFAKRANLASERREEIAKLKQKKLKYVTDPKTNYIQNNNKPKLKASHSWFYWLFNAEISDLIRSLVR